MLQSKEPFSIDIGDGLRGFVTGGKYESVRQAVYTRQQELESVAVPPPAAVFEREKSLTLTIQVVCTGPDGPASFQALTDSLLNQQAPIEWCQRLEGMR